MFCAISGEAPEIPVLSRTSGNIFEKRLLDSYVAEHGKDPTNGEEMGADDIVEIKTSRTVRPRPPTATSIPSLLSIFQNEWDSLALETYQIRQQLYQTRQELSTALYQHDAACRVIARITKERDEAREALSKVSQSINGSNGAEAMETDVPDSVIPQEIQEVISATLEQESATRKKRKVPEGWTTAEQLAGLKHIRSKKADTNLLDEHRIEQDGQIISRHPSGSLVAMSSRDRDWTVRNSADSEALVTIHNNSEITSLSFHPDGHLVALGCEDGNVNIFHLLTGKVEAIFGPAQGSISSLAFSENGFWLAVATEAETAVKIWHLGKSSVVAELEVPTGTTDVTWDHSGQFLACVGAAGLKVWAYTKAGKTWSVAHETAGAYTRVVWKPEARGVVLEGSKGREVYAL